MLIVSGLVLGVEHKLLDTSDICFKERTVKARSLPVTDMMQIVMTLKTEDDNEEEVQKRSWSCRHMSERR